MIGRGRLMFEMRTTDDIVRIAAAGGGMRLDCSKRTTEDIVRVAAAASMSNARLTLTGLGMRTTDDLVRIAAAGKGSVFYDS
jgi:hypothetical protein